MAIGGPSVEKRACGRALVLALGVSLALTGSADAATIVGTSRSDVLRGTPRADFVDGRGGKDRVLARAGDDRIRAQDRVRDSIACGAGHDLVNGDLVDAVAGDCEVVVRQISRDPYRNSIAQHETQVEPDTFAFGSTVVAVFQSGRVVNGGASNTGFATSVDAGRSWRSGFMPGLTPNATPPGSYERASDPVVAYDARHGVWLGSSLLVSLGLGTAIVVNRSPDGIRWDGPVTVNAAPGPQLGYDKQWLVCDNGAASPFAGSCYMVYSDLDTNRMVLQTSRDGGLTWSPPIGSPDNAGRRGIFGRFAPAPQPLVRPDGVLVIPFYDEDRLAVVRSLDGGATLTTTTVLASTRFAPHISLRDPPLPSAEIAGDGTIYIVWADCSFHAACTANDLVLSRSADGTTWTAPTRIPTGSTATHLIPGLAVDATSAGGSTRLALAYYTVSGGALHVGFVSSSNGGGTWTRQQRLNAQPMALEWLPDTTAGLMVGDYISTSFVGGRAVPVAAIASARDAQRNQAMFAAVLPVP